MIISASRRTDIPAYYTDWFFARLRAGYCVAANPYNIRQQRRVDLRPEAVDGIVFWTKDPRPMLDRLGLLRDYAYYFHCTVTGAGVEVEPALADKVEKIVPAVLKIADHAGPEAVVWRFDPLVFGGKYTPEYHAEHFSALAGMLHGAVRTCVFSFYAPYAAADRRMAALGLRGATPQEKRETAALLGREATRWGIALESCCEGLDLAAFGITRSRCVDAGRLSRIAGMPIAAKRDKNQRPGCGCDAAVDIGAYGSCPAGCAYCYAMRGAGAAAFLARHDPQKDEGLGPCCPGTLDKAVQT